MITYVNLLCKLNVSFKYSLTSPNNNNQNTFLKKLSGTPQQRNQLQQVQVKWLCTFHLFILKSDYVISCVCIRPWKILP